MTPLAQAILADYAKPSRARRFASNGVQTDVPKELLSAHAFELTAVHDMVQPLGLKMSDVQEGLLGGLQQTQLAFLPAPNTWIEYAVDVASTKQRHGILLLSAEEFALGVLCIGWDGGMEAVAEIALPLSGSENFGQIRTFPPKVDWVPADWVGHMVRDVYAMLSIINSPRVIGRKQHMPHGGLQRKIAASRGMVGKFPLHAWSEIVLEVTPPTLADGEHEGRLSGSKALHFCRAHLRIQNGRLVLVSAHWRGDPALGMKQTRYRLTPPKSVH
jgi:hypothetical protein